MARERSLAIVLRTTRMQQRLSQLQLALAMGASSTSYMSKLENGRCHNPSRLFLGQYVAAYALLGRPLTKDQRDVIAKAVLGTSEEAA